MDNSVIESVCKEYRMSNATVRINCNASVDDLIDVIEGNRHYVRFFTSNFFVRSRSRPFLRPSLSISLSVKYILNATIFWVNEREKQHIAEQRDFGGKKKRDDIFPSRLVNTTVEIEVVKI